MEAGTRFSGGVARPGQRREVSGLGGDEMMTWTWILVLLMGRGDGRFSELSEALESRHAATRRVAVRELADLGSAQAWELVLSRLGEEDGEVADEAQWQLARAPLV